MLGRHVLLTGAASGIGYACALNLARRGARLALVDLDTDGLHKIIDEIRMRGGTAEPIVADLQNGEHLVEVASEATRLLGHVDILFNNAGVAVVKPMLSTTDGDWEWIVDINVRAPIRLARALLPQMIARRSGQLVFMASVAGLCGAPGMVAYSTTKFALVGFAESLRIELADAGVGVTVICPGYVRTNLHRATRYANEGFSRLLESPPPWYGLTKERAAEAIVEAVAQRRQLLALGPEKIGWWLKRAWPNAHASVARWVAERFKILPPIGP
jgi:NAD(P)-dependent dehydrogenase (short-subunit alcohol dehydrogenase family)